MTIPARKSPLVATIVLMGATAIGSVALAATTLPAEQHYGSVEFIVGGIGQSESVALERASPHWPLALEFAVKDGSHADFVTDVDVAVRDAQGKTVLESNSAGPFLLAKLPPGRYTVDAKFDGRSLSERVDVKHAQSARSTMVWPSGAGEHPA